MIVMTSDDSMWWPLNSPPMSWSTTTILLVSLASSCRTKDKFLTTPLLQRTPFVALTCPYSSRGALNVKPYSVWTWLPFAHEHQLVRLGFWNGNHFKSWNDFFIDRFQDMSAKKMLVDGSSEDRPLLQKDKDGRPFGVNFLILQVLSGWLNYQLELDLEGNNDWSVLMESVRKGERDMMINYATFTPERNKDFELSVPYHYEGFGLMLKVPPPLPLWQNVLFPFAWEVWGAIAGSFLVTAITFHLLHYRYQSSFLINAIIIIKSLVASPLPKVPTIWRIRGFLLMWWLVSWILDLSYTCNLIAVLTVPIFPKKIQITQELAKSSNRVCMLDYGEFVPEALATSSHQTLSSLGRKLDLVPLRLELDNVGEEGCVELVLAGTHAHTETYSYLKILYSNLGHNLEVYSLKEQLYPGYLSFLIQKHSPWNYKFDIGMQKLIETGLIQKWYKDIMDEFKGVAEEHQAELQPLALAHLQGPFLLLLSGFFVAVIMMGAEVIYGVCDDRE